MPAQARLQFCTPATSSAGAEATIAELAKLPKAGERAAVLKTKILARQGKHAEAIAELDRLIASYPKGSERQRDAMLAKAESLAGAKQFKEAETLVRQVIQGNPAEDSTAQAPAYNTLGDCLRAANRPKDALIAYLHTDLLYSKSKEENIPVLLHHIVALYPPAQARRPRWTSSSQRLEARVSAQLRGAPAKSIGAVIPVLLR